MKPLAETYSWKFFRKRVNLLWRAPIVCDAVEKTFQIKVGASIIDIGCAIGEYICEFRNRGFAAIGWEGSEEALEFVLNPDWVKIVDIRKPIYPWAYDIYKAVDLYKAYSVCMCLEVAEHIEPEYVYSFTANLCFLSDNILISAAPPGQEGVGHHNCQPKVYWEEKFGLCGYKRDLKSESIFKSSLELHKKKKGLNGYYYNTMVFRRGGADA